MFGQKLFMRALWDLFHPLKVAVANGNNCNRTGGTGFIGGSVLEAITKKFPAVQVIALLRSPSTEFKSRYPNVKIVVGDFDAFKVIEGAAADADIVIRTT